MLWKRQLAEYAVNLGSVVKLIYKLLELLLGGALRHEVLKRLKTYLLACLLLVSHIYL